GFPGGTINVSCGGAPQGASCTASPNSLPATGGSSVTQNVSIALITTARSSAALNTGPALWWTMAIIFGLMFSRRRPRRTRAALVTMIAVAMLTALLSCGGGNNGGGGGGTPPGTYTMTVMAATTSGPSASNSVTLTVTVR